MAVKNDKKLIGLATKGKGKANTVVKKPEVKVIEKPKTPEETRDLKAKEIVKKLLDDVNLTPNTIKDEEIFDITSTETKQMGGDWLQEQVALLASENEVLKQELAVAKDNYTKIFSDMQRKKDANPNELNGDTTTQNIIQLFSELQNNMLGRNNERTIWTTVNIKHVLNQMLVMFPITNQYRKF